MTNQAFTLAGTARIMADGGDKVRIRTGVWNYEEAVIDTSRESPAVARTIASAMQGLTTGPTVLDEHLDAGLLPIERANIEQLFNDLAAAGVLVTEENGRAQDAVTAALLGRLTSPFPGGEPGGILFATDCEAAHDQAASLAAGMRVPLTRLPAEVHEELGTLDLTTRMEGFDTERAIERLRGHFTGVAALVTCFQRPSLPWLRNLNRVLDGRDLAWISGLIDGPFVTVVGHKSPYTGCFECFESRALARLEDHVTYHDFARSPVGRRGDNDADAPMMSLVTTMAVTEGYLHAVAGTSRLSGRALGIHLPTMEIQMQELLRMPNCPACGRIARQRLQEINFSSRAAVDRIVSSVLR